ncbi:MAG: NADH-quinone oxidoreductase subunit J [bacterium]|nr:NADH-quinone oxidoreductase subunit J [bacterium]
MNAELFVFIIFAASAIFGALTLISARNPVYSAMGLLLTMLSIAVFYVLMDAHFIAVVQVLIYAGAVMTLFLFVIMLIGVDKKEDRDEQIPFHRPMVAILGGGLVLLLLLAGRGAWVVVDTGLEQVGTIEAISDALFGGWMLPFQATILLLTIAAIGSIALARYEPRSQDDTVSPLVDDVVSPPSGGKVPPVELEDVVSPPSGGKVPPAKPGVGGSS